jgi:hypothetical protein
MNIVWLYIIINNIKRLLKNTPRAVTLSIHEHPLETTESSDPTSIVCLSLLCFSFGTSFSNIAIFFSEKN